MLDYRLRHHDLGGLRQAQVLAAAVGDVSRHPDREPDDPRHERVEVEDGHHDPGGPGPEGSEDREQGERSAADPELAGPAIGPLAVGLHLPQTDHR